MKSVASGDERPAGGWGSAAKRITERLATLIGTTRISRLRHRSQGVILAYHNVVSDDAAPVGDRSLHLSRSAFSAQLDQLGRTHEVVPLRRILEGPNRDEPVPEDRRRARPLAAITFDDAYRGAMTIGLDELSAKGMSATVFAAPGLLGDRSTWWDLLSDPALGAPRPEVRDRALREFNGVQEHVLAAFDAQAAAAEALPPDVRTVTETELRAASDRYELDVGSHTWSHANLARLGEEEILEEYSRSADWLAARFPRFVPWLAYPYGLSSPLAERLASRTYGAALRLGGGYTDIGPPRGRRQRVPRVNVPSGVSTAGFELRAAGMIRR